MWILMTALFIPLYADMLRRLSLDAKRRAARARILERLEVGMAQADQITVGREEN